MHELNIPTIKIELKFTVIGTGDDDAVRDARI